MEMEAPFDGLLPMIIKLVARRVLLHVVLRHFHSLTSSFFFSGVYFTSTDPSNDPETILLGDYDYTGRVEYSERLWKKIDWVIEVEMDINEVETVCASNGDAAFYKGDVDLKNYQYCIYKNSIETLYHYTDATGAAGIKESKFIRKSTHKTPIQNRRHGCGKSLVC